MTAKLSVPASADRTPAWVNRHEVAVVRGAARERGPEPQDRVGPVRGDRRMCVAIRVERDPGVRELLWRAERRPGTGWPECREVAVPHHAAAGRRDGVG